MLVEIDCLVHASATEGPRGLNTRGKILSFGGPLNADPEGHVLSLHFLNQLRVSDPDDPKIEEAKAHYYRQLQRRGISPLAVIHTFNTRDTSLSK